MGIPREERSGSPYYGKPPGVPSGDELRPCREGWQDAGWTMGQGNGLPETLTALRTAHIRLHVRTTGGRRGAYQ